MKRATQFAVGILALSLGALSLSAQAGGTFRKVTNPKPTLWTGSAGWRLIPEREILVPVGTAHELGNPFAPALGRDGTLYVLDRKPVGIKVFGKDGKFLRTIGREGAGPGEFSARALLALHGDTLLVLDRSTQRLLVFSSEGKALSESLLKDITPDDILGSEGGAPIPVVGRTGANQVSVLRVNTRGVEVARTVLPPVPPSPSFPACATRVPFSPQVVLVPERGGDVVWGKQDALTFVRSRTGKDTSLVFAATGAAPKVGKDDLERLFGAKGTLTRLCPNARASDLPKTKPRWQDLHVDASGNIWVALTPDPAPAFQVFSREGVLLGRVDDPKEAGVNRWWFGDQAVEFLPGDDGGMRIRIWRVDRRGKR